MTTLAVNVNMVFEEVNVPYNTVPVVAADIIYKGAAVGDNGAGYARPLFAGDTFLGFADSQADNHAGSAGDVLATVRTEGRAVLSITGVTSVADKGKPVYASDDATFTLTEAGNSYIGRIIRYHAGAIAIVEFDAAHAGLGLITPLTDNTTGTVSTTLAAIAATAPADLTAQGVINGKIANALASIAAEFNSLAKRIK